LSATPSLDLVSEEVERQMDAQERRGSALDSKAGVLLGFTGILVGLTATLSGSISHVALGFSALAAILAGSAFLPRSFPTMSVLRLREQYLTSRPEFTKLTILDTQIAMHVHSKKLLNQKSRLVAAATAALGIAVILTVVGAIVK